MRKDTVKKQAQERMLAETTIRKYFLVTLIHGEKRTEVGKDKIVERMAQLFRCRSIVVAMEKHDEEKGGIH